MKRPTSTTADHLASTYDHALTMLRVTSPARVRLYLVEQHAAHPWTASDVTALADSAVAS